MSNGTITTILLLLGAMLAQQGSAQRAIHVPPDADPALKNVRANADAFCPIRKTHVLSVVLNHPNTATISHLLMLQSPDAIIWPIAAVVVNSFDAMRVAGSWSHVGQESFKGIEPLITNVDTASAIVRIRSVIGIVASLHHRCPDFVFGRSGLTVSGECFYGCLPLKAAARQAFHLMQAARDDIANRSAFAPASPVRTTTGLYTDVSKHSPKANCLSAQVFDVLRKANNIAGSHEVFLSSEGNLWLEPAGVQPLVRLVSFYPMLAQVESIAVPALLNEASRVATATAAATNGQTSVIYLFVVVISIGAIGGFFVLRYMLTHAREIHTEANRTLLDISAKHETRCDSLTKAFAFECAQLRQVILRTISDSRDMVHATREIASVAVSSRELLGQLSKKEDEIKAKQDRNNPVET
jgi:hypothetical protein